MKPRINVVAELSALSLFALIGALPAQGQTTIKPRILRLSFVQGHVSMQRPDVQGWADAPVNTPLEQGFKLSTGDNSFAEIQFENGSTIRLGEQSLVELTELGPDANGGESNRVDLRQGYGTFHPLEEALQVETPLGGLTASAGAEFRVDLDQGMERIEVFSGEVQEESNLGSMPLQKDSVLVMQPGTSDSTQLSEGITQDDWDNWVADREAQADVAARGASPGSYAEAPNAVPYGWTDLAQNGTWIDVEDEGYGWLPQTTVGWSPYSSGQWCWYPGIGYTWIGSESWGWLPYHYGDWEFVPGRGWVWFPGSFKTWSPAQVTWYQGPGWVGWRPRSHKKNPRNDCGSVCGGGIVRANTLSQGGYVSQHSMLEVNIAGGTTVNTPSVNPAPGAMLPGVPAAFPSAQGHSSQWTISRPQIGPWAAAPATIPSRPRRGDGTTNPNPGIVYDPQQGNYVNSHWATRPLVQPAFPSGASHPATINPQAANPTPGPSPVRAPLQPFPNAGQQPVVPPLAGQVAAQPTQGAFASPPPIVTVPNNSGGSHANAGAGQGAAGQPGNNRGGSGGPAGAQTGNNRGGTWAPAGGSNHGSAPVGGPGAAHH